MSLAVNLPIILSAAFIATASPGPATLGIASMSMGAGRGRGVAMALGVVTSSLTWSAAAALGLGAVMLANAWILETIRYVGAGYLLYLAVKLAWRALHPQALTFRSTGVVTSGEAYRKGLLLHLTNPKAVLFFGALYSVGVPPDAPAATLLVVIIAVGLQSTLIFLAYALLFSSATVARSFARVRRLFDGLLAVAFGYASFKILTAHLR
ncbi:amino acid transporter [Pleomorphomonas diazotrophica]|uniref:Amino acid transporter n=1 Tax=Pleomorphomonas diazotrophica TaxID=1166257 RepID=A0A1I4QXX2_9HYPH|nr:LysE family transporter [Pleomorphomonas diazotrophica]PKR90342.1 amino acid transporter [Pleomorphomonas diazotrophica]SFM44879.1 Threonine/homoserine/homoserine lactone efflux protein [Pleomorphomonas diazotrophica]